MSCAEKYEHGCLDCEDWKCPYRDYLWEDPMTIESQQLGKEVE